MPAVCEYTVVTKLNEYAISAAGVGEAMQRSAAALAAANNSFEESIGLIVAANTTAQDPMKVGTTLKTVSMYLRAAKTEAEDAGELTIMAHVKPAQIGEHPEMGNTEGKAA